ncbi:MAG TPA: GNAT family N-acetyltransferase [Pirellulales bacterium]|nr:GNAT family N-acetyltransferase [Pirellulales bacterium]
MEETFRIRPATNGDAPAVRRLVFTILCDHGLAPDPASTDADLDDLEANYHRRRGSFDVLVDRDGQIIGSVGISPIDDKRCELRKMYLASACRGQGLGKRLLEQALDRARKLGFRRIELETAATLVAAVKLYESFGFRPFEPEHLSARCDQAYFLELGEGGPHQPERRL